MNQLQRVFNYQGAQIRTVTKDGEVWFVAKDVCDVLGHSDTSMAVKRLDEDEKLIQTLFGSGQNREMWFVNEPGLYSLILTSRKSEAKAFKRWITHEVLPSIRKTGQYQLQPQPHFQALQLEIEREKIKLAKSELLLRIGQAYPNLSPESQQVLVAYAAKEVAGQEILPLPKLEGRLYSATEIAEELGVTANKIGRIAKKYDLKTPEFGVFVLDKSRYSNKQVETFRYNEKGKEQIAQILAEEGRVTH